MHSSHSPWSTLPEHVSYELPEVCFLEFGPKTTAYSVWESTYSSEVFRKAVSASLYDTGRGVSFFDVWKSVAEARKRAAQTYDLSWLFAAQARGPAKGSSGDLMAVIAGLNAMLKRREFSMIDKILTIVRPAQLSPETMLALARVTFAVRDKLPHWSRFVRRIRSEITNRGLDAHALLKGLG